MKKILIFIFFIIILIFSVNVFALDKAISCNSSYGKTLNISPTSYCQNVGGVNVTMSFISIVKNNYDINYSYKVYCGTSVECQYNSDNPCSSDSNTYLNSSGQCESFKQCWDSSKVKQSEQCPTDTRVICWDGSKANTQEQCPVNPCLVKQQRVKTLQDKIESLTKKISLIKTIIEGLEKILEPPVKDYPDYLSTNPEPSTPPESFPDLNFDGLPDYCIDGDLRAECQQEYQKPPELDPNTTDPNSAECQTSCCGNDPRYGTASEQTAGLRQDLARDRVRANLRVNAMKKFQNDKRTGFDAGRADALNYYQDVLCSGNDCSLSYCDLNQADTDKCSLYHDFQFKELSDFGTLQNQSCSCEPILINFGAYGQYSVNSQCDFIESTKETLSVVVIFIIAFSFVRIVLSA